MTARLYVKNAAFPPSPSGYGMTSGLSLGSGGAGLRKIRTLGEGREECGTRKFKSRSRSLTPFAEGGERVRDDNGGDGRQ
jgi:hypothetical protein